MPLTHHREPFYDTLRLSEADRQALMQGLDAKQASARYTEMREDARLAYTVRGLVVQMHHPGGSRVNYIVRPRNLSRQGLAFLHGSFCYTGTPCDVHLRTAEGAYDVQSGRVIRCALLQGTVHEVALLMDKPIDPQRYLGSAVGGEAPGAASRSLPRLKGRVLLVEDSVDDRELLRFHLAPLGLELEVAADTAGAMKQLEAGRFDLILTGAWLDDGGRELIEQVRAANVATPIVLLTADHGPDTAERATQAGAASVLTKPYELEDLINTLGKHVLIAPDPDSEPVLSEHWNDVKMRPLIISYLGRLEQQIDQLGKLLHAADEHNAALKLCAAVRGSSGGYGFPQVCQAADKLHHALTDAADADQLRQQFAELYRLTAAAGRSDPRQ